MSSGTPSGTPSGTIEVSVVPQIQRRDCASSHRVRQPVAASTSRNRIACRFRDLRSRDVLLARSRRTRIRRDRPAWSGRRCLFACRDWSICRSPSSRTVRATRRSPCRCSRDRMMLMWFAQELSSQCLVAFSVRGVHTTNEAQNIVS